YNQLLTKLPPDDFDGAKAVWAEMKALEPPVAPNPYTCAEIAKRAPTTDAGLDVLDELITHGGEPNSFAYIPILQRPGAFEATFAIVQRVEKIGESISIEMSSILGSRVSGIEEMDRARDLLLPHQMAGYPFYCSVYQSCACDLLSADELLDWAFAKGKTSFDAFQTAVNKYSKLGKLDESLRIASAFPHFPVCRKLFQRFPDAAESYLSGRFEAGLEPANAATALGYFYKSINRSDLAIIWFNKALKQADVSDGKRRHVQKELRNLGEPSH
ncbi:hypothetical protein, partial [Pararhodobacter sp. SW119]|uniref:hypothetical protein n=1 Tax=Pararhodobacter sp. SW119 TaxID=2780075 RepID=UPI001ADFF83B